MSGKKVDQAQIDAQRAEFLAKGREIEVVAPGQTGEAFGPRTKKDQRAEVRRRSWNRLQKDKGQ